MDENYGAFKDCHSLKYVSIPKTCKKIGDYSFENTQVEKVIIPEDCKYNYSTTFPESCVIWRYEYLINGPLITSNHEIIVSSDDIQINIRE